MRCAPFLIGNTAPAFDPATLLPDGWWRGPFSGSPWLPTAPGDQHGNLITLGTAPLVGAGLNGIASAKFDGITSRGLRSVAASSNFLGGAGGSTMLVLFRASQLTPDQTAWFSEAPLLGVDGGDMGFSNAVDGVRGGDGTGTHNTPYVALANNVWAMCAFRVGGTTGRIRVSQQSGTVDSAPFSGLTALNLDAFLKIGINWNDTVLQTGELLEILTWKRQLSDAELVSMKSYCNSRYLQSFA